MKDKTGLVISRHREPGAVVGFAVGLFAVCALVALACVGVTP